MQAASLRHDRAALREKWGISADAFCVLFCGKFIPKKRPLDLIKAAQLLITNNQLPNLHLLFVGSGELGAELRANCNVVFDAESVQRSENRDPRSEKTNLTSDRSLSAVAEPPTSET